MCAKFHRTIHKNMRTFRIKIAIGLKKLRDDVVDDVKNFFVGLVRIQLGLVFISFHWFSLDFIGFIGCGWLSLGSSMVFPHPLAG